MNLLFSMTLSGSVMVLLCMAIKWGVRKLPERIYYALWKVCILYFLIPTPFLKKLYQPLLKWIREMAGRMEADTDMIQIWWRNSPAVMEHNGVNYYTPAFRLQFFFTAVWIGAAVAILLYFFLRYVRQRKRLEGSLLLEQSKDQEMIDQWKSECHILRSLRTSPCSLRNICFTLGVLRPVIVYSEQCTPLEKELLLRHELVHVRRWDMLWQYLMVIALTLHWFNPFVWVLRSQVRRSCERSCDEAVLEGRSEMECSRYMEMIILRAMVKDTNLGVLPFAERAGKRTRKNREIEERINNIMNMKNKKNVGKIVAAILVASVTVLNSVTALAYEDVQFLSLNPCESLEEEDVWIDNTPADADYFFVPDGVVDLTFESSLELERVYYDVQFTDENGNIYPVGEFDLCASCEHAYVAGQIKEHKINSNGGCVLIIYEGQRCSKCGNVEYGEIVNEATYKVCPH